MTTREDVIKNKLIEINDRFGEIEMLTKTIVFWIKERDYELIPIANILNEKICNMAEIIRK